MTAFTRAESLRDRDHAAACPYCRQGPGRCECEGREVNYCPTCDDDLEHCTCESCHRCGRKPAPIRVVVQSIGGEPDEYLTEEECEELEDQHR